MAVTRLADHLVGGTHAARPVATAVPVGTLYSCTDHSLIYQSDGATWSTYATLGASPLTTKGDLYGYSTGNDRLAVGTDGQVLSASSGAATGLAWADPSAEPLTTKGDVYVYSSTPTRLAVGSDGQTLVADSSATEGVAWKRPATGLDVVAHFDDYYDLTTGSYDYEFGAADTTSLPAGWSWVNQGDSDYREVGGCALIYGGSTGGTTDASETHRMIVRSLPSESTWTAVLSIPSIAGLQSDGNYMRAGIVLRDSAGGDYLFFGRKLSSGGVSNTLSADYCSALNTIGSNLRSDVTPDTTTQFIVQRVAATVYTFTFSADGYSQWGFTVDDPTSHGLSLDQIGILLGCPSGGGGLYATVDWFRVRT